ncbi:hypothetical protein EYF80_035383 [Liparis tanakae]|uniref:Uncharacterized protein n=1 Tax=Liparis tanakae TaxID=230148 RepID=A0A4Z2GNT8_9TELE|nr:hypothetical protein EYF80_035383 [Liparis tanakae]
MEKSCEKKRWEPPYISAALESPTDSRNNEHPTNKTNSFRDALQPEAPAAGHPACAAERFQTGNI